MNIIETKSYLQKQAQVASQVAMCPSCGKVTNSGELHASRDKVCSDCKVKQMTPMAVEDAGL